MDDIDANPEALGRILQHMPEIVLVVDREGIVRYINRVEEGYDRDQVIGSAAEAIMTPEAKVVFWATLEALLDSGETQEFDTEVIAPDGGTQWYRSRMVPVRKDGKITSALLVTTNVTELKAVEGEAERLRQLLPICSWCDKIQSEAGEWETVEAYVNRREGTTISHGLCPDCFRRQLEGDDGLEGENGSAA